MVMKKLLVIFISFILLGQPTLVFSADPYAPPLIRKHLGPVDIPTDYLKSTGQKLLNVARAILRNKTLAASTAAAIATALSLYYLYTHPEEAAQMVEKVGAPLAGTAAAALIAKRALSSQPQPPLAYPAVRKMPAREKVIEKRKIVETKPLSAAQTTEQDLEQAFKETRLKARLEEYVRRKKEKEQEKTFEQIWQSKL